MGETISDTQYAKRQSILNVALKVFAKQGYRNTDVQVIADLAKVGKGTVYRHFGNKQQLFMATAEYSMHEAGRAFGSRVSINEKGEVSLSGRAPNSNSTQPIDPDDAVEVLREIGRRYAGYYHDNPEAIEIMIHERSEFGDSIRPSHLAYREAERCRMDNFFKLAMKRGLVREYNERQLTNAFADLLFGSVTNGYLENGKRGLNERVESAVDLFLHGICI